MKANRRPLAVVAVVALGLACPLAAGAQSSAQKPAAARATTPAPASPEAAPERLFKAWDANHDGSLSEQEFLAGWNRVRNRVQAEQRLAAQFRRVDANHDGGIDATEYAKLEVVRQAGKSAQPLQAFDANHDQRLQFAEYVAMLERVGPRARQPVAPQPQPRPAAPAPVKR